MSRVSECNTELVVFYLPVLPPLRHLGDEVHDHLLDLVDFIFLKPNVLVETRFSSKPGMFEFGIDVITVMTLRHESYLLGTPSLDSVGLQFS